MGRLVVGVSCVGVGRGRVTPGGQRGMRPQGLGYLFLVSRLGEVSPSCAGLGCLQVWLGCLWGHLRGQSGLCHRWWRVYFSRGQVGVGFRISCGWVGVEMRWDLVGVCILIGFELEVGLELGLIYTFAGGGFGVRLELG